MAITEVIKESTTVGHLLGISDQLNAAVTEVWQAWGTLVNGPTPATNVAGAQPVGNDRIEVTYFNINQSIGSLVELAASIRNRS